MSGHVQTLQEFLYHDKVSVEGNILSKLSSYSRYQDYNCLGLEWSRTVADDPRKIYGILPLDTIPKVLKLR